MQQFRDTQTAESRGGVADPKSTTGSDESAKKEAWVNITLILGSQVWTASETNTYRGFFGWGWDARRQVERRLAVIDSPSPGYIERRYIGSKMVLCPQCGNKRCPHANDPRYKCTNSNEWGQVGSAYPATLGAKLAPEPANEWQQAILKEVAATGMSLPSGITPAAILKALIATHISMAVSHFAGVTPKADPEI